MAHRVVMPTFGMYTAEATLSRWLVPAGTRVEAGASIVEIEAEKASYEVEAPASGILHPTAAEGAALSVEGLIGWILAEGEAPPGDVAIVDAPTRAGTSPAPTSESGSPGLILQPSGFKASPAARRLAAEKGVDLAGLTGTGPGGRIVEADVLAAAGPVASHPAAELARKIRRHCVLMTSRANASHIGSSLSTADLLAVLYGKFLRFDPQRPDWPDRDRFILSKGHGCAALYAVLAECGYFPVERLDTFYQDGSPLAGHATHKDVAGVEVSTGSLGHGLSLGAGMALAAKRDRRDRRGQEDRRVWCMLSDGECDEGSVWEAALFAPHHRLDNLVAILDYNKIQSFGAVKDVLDLEPLGEKWRAFGWGVREIDGHDLAAIEQAYAAVPFVPGKPSCIVAHTVKGKGVSYMEGKLLWHYRAPRGEDLQAALRELGEPA
jgi:transketolase